MASLLSVDHILPRKPNFILLSQAENENPYFFKTKKVRDPRSVLGSRLRQSEPAVRPVRSEKPPIIPLAKADRTKRAVVRRVMRELFPKGPVGFTNKLQLRRVNDQMKKEDRQEVSMSTLRRAREEEFGW